MTQTSLSVILQSLQKKDGVKIKEERRHWKKKKKTDANNHVLQPILVETTAGQFIIFVLFLFPIALCYKSH